MWRESGRGGGGPRRLDPTKAHLPLSPSPPEGGGGTQAAPASPPSPPLGAERAGVRWGC